MEGKDLENRILNTQTGICNSFRSASKSSWRRGMRRVGEIPEIRLLQRDCKELAQLRRQQND